MIGIVVVVVLSAVLMRGLAFLVKDVFREAGEPGSESKPSAENRVRRPHHVPLDDLLGRHAHVSQQWTALDDHQLARFFGNAS